MSEPGTLRFPGSWTATLGRPHSESPPHTLRRAILVHRASLASPPARPGRRCSFRRGLETARDLARMLRLSSAARQSLLAIARSGRSQRTLGRGLPHAAQVAPEKATNNQLRLGARRRVLRPSPNHRGCFSLGHWPRCLPPVETDPSNRKKALSNSREDTIEESRSPPAEDRRSESLGMRRRPSSCCNTRPEQNEGRADRLGSHSEPRIEGHTKSPERACPRRLPWLRSRARPLEPHRP
mmetsp:Transcript_34154/g.72652  ORF Transcript_34154/g.72652 Transcript_34154/m.72652 type:complete len:239 (-) Transcript_34154:518-1234(-)